MKYFVIKEIGCDDWKPYAVVHRQAMLNGSDHLVVTSWFEKEDEARALAHSMLFPEY